MIPGFYVAVVFAEAARMANTPAIRSMQAARATPKGSRSLLCAGTLVAFIPSHRFLHIFLRDGFGIRSTGTPEAYVAGAYIGREGGGHFRSGARTMSLCPPTSCLMDALATRDVYRNFFQNLPPYGGCVVQIKLTTADVSSRLRSLNMTMGRSL